MMKNDVLRAARAQAPHLLSFLQDLVRIPSVNGRETEAAVAQRIFEEAQRLKLDARLVAATSDRPNLVVQWGEGEAGFALIGHMDTVAEGEASLWRYPPFSATLNRGRLYGRGAADNKAGIACGLYAIALIRDLRLLEPDRSRVILACVVDEESGASSPHGMRYLLDHDEVQASGAIYTYASDTICIGHRGLLRLILRATGQSTHSGSRSWACGAGGTNAVTGLAAILLQLEKLQPAYEPHSAFSGLGFTATPTMFSGGEFESMVPACAEALVDMRLMPGQLVDDLLGAVKDLIRGETGRRPGLSVTVEVKNRLPAAAIPAGHRLVKVTEEAARTFTGRRWPVAGAGPANEGYMLIEAGIPTICGFGPEGGDVHAPNEWVTLESLPVTTTIYATIVRHYLT
jgi:acetylornithine deacetylase/succinyl-diaminopimelate desuccinylase-like protein